MNIIGRHFVLFMTAFISVISTEPSVAQKTEDQQKRPDMAKLRELANPGPEHDKLEKYAGKWQLKVIIGDGDSAAETNGRANSYMTLERRFLWLGYNVDRKSGRTKGSFTIGFDRRNDRYSLVAMDTYGTYFVTSHGKKEEKSGRIRLHGTDDDPYMKSMGYDKEFLHVIDFTKPDEFTIEVYFIDTRTSERKENKAMTFQFTRTK